jgi:hypothetical protein
MKKRICIFLFLFFIFKVSTLLAQKTEKDNAIELTKQENKIYTINNGIYELPNYYYDHYYKYPKSVEELCLFIESHYDYVNDPDKIWKYAISYLKHHEKKINIHSMNNLFIIWENKKISYNLCDICTTVALQEPRPDFYEFISSINLYDKDNINIRQKIGSERTDSIIDIFRKKRKSFPNQLDSVYFKIEQTPYNKLDKNRWVVLEYSLQNGLQSFCNEKKLTLDNEYFTKLEDICKQFCVEQNIARMAFCNLVVIDKE